MYKRPHIINRRKKRKTINSNVVLIVTSPTPNPVASHRLITGVFGGYQSTVWSTVFTNRQEILIVLNWPTNILPNSARPARRHLSRRTWTSRSQDTLTTKPQLPVF